MSSVLGFAVGFVSGWAARSTVESSRAAAVNVASTVMAFIDRAKRAIAIEGDYLEDFAAEVRSRSARSDGRRWEEASAASNSGNSNSSVASAGNGGVP